MTIPDSPQPTRPSLRDEIKTRRGPVGLGLTEEQRKERNNLQAKAAALAMQVLKSRHKDEYDDLYRQAKEEYGVGD